MNLFSQRTLQYFFCILLLSSVLNVACRKKPNSIPVDTDLRKTFSYKKGTYWIYNDVATGNTDSLVVSNDRYYVEETNLGTEDRETHSISIFKNGVAIPGGGEWTLTTHRVYVQLILQPPTLHYGFNFPLSANRDSVAGTDSLDVGTYSSFDVGRTEYLNVTVMHYWGQLYDSYPYSSGPQYYCNDTFYVNIDAGILQICHNSPAIHNDLRLVRYHIVR